MKRILTTVLVTSLIMAILLGGASFYMYKQSQKVGSAKEEKAKQELDIFLEGQHKEVYDRRYITSIAVDTSEPKWKKVSSGEYTKSQNKVLKEKRKKNLYDFESPLWMWNVYGTNQLSMYLYFKSTEAAYVTYTIQVEDELIPNFKRTLYNGEKNNLAREHEYQLLGFVPGQENLIVLEMYDEKDELLNKKVFAVDVPEISEDIAKSLVVSSGRSKQQVSNGLYALFDEKMIGLYDNSGILRGALPITKRGAQKIYIEDGKMYYSIDPSHIMRVNRLGAVERVYSLGDYKQYDDFIYNGYGDFWLLATKSGKKSRSVKDTVISLSLEDGRVSELFCMENLLPKMKAKAKKPKKAKEFNWIDLTALTQVNSDEVIVSSGELSSIFKIVNINSRSPRISYIIGEKEIWKGTPYDKKLLGKVGQEEVDATQEAAQAESILDVGEAPEVFLSPFGVSWLQYEKSPELSEGQYYLYVWDSNYGASPTRKNIAWSEYSGIGTKNKDARVSYIKRLMIDENAVNYDMPEEEQQEVAFTKNLGALQFYGAGRIDNYGSMKEYAEYDDGGKMIRKFTHGISGVTQVEKKDYKKFWFS